MSRLPGDYRKDPDLGEEDLDSVVLTEELTSLDMSISSLKASIKSAKSGSDNKKALQSQLSDAETRREKVVKQLAALATYDSNSASFFDDLTALESNLTTGLSAISSAMANFNGSFSIPSKDQLAWARSVTTQWNQRQAVLEKLSNGEELDDEDVKAIETYLGAEVSKTKEILVYDDLYGYAKYSISVNVSHDGEVSLSVEDGEFNGIEAGNVSVDKDGGVNASKVIYNIYRKSLLILFIISFIALILGLYNYSQNNIFVLIVFNVVIYAVFGIMLYCWRFLNSILREILVTDIDLDKYCGYFEYAYKKSNRVQKPSTLQESYVADGQCYFFKGDFSQSQESFRNVQPQKVIWYRRKPITFAVAYYTLLNYLHQKDFVTYEVDLAKFQKLEDKNVAERVKKLSAIHDVLTGQTTSYFSQRTPEHKLDKVETTYYDGLNCLNQGNQVKAKELFQSILSENSELFYVREAKKYLEEL